MSQVLFVLLTEGFDQIGIGKQAMCHFESHWPGERLRIVDRDLNVHVAEVAAVKAFRDLHRFTVEMAHGIESASIIETRRLDHEPVAFPLANGVAQPAWLRIHGMLPAICKDLAKDGVPL